MLLQPIPKQSNSRIIPWRYRYLCPSRMVKLSQVQASNAQVGESNHIKTAVFVGATSGIGRAALTELVAASEKRHGLRIYVVGRSNTTAATTEHLNTLRQKGTAELVYLEGDVSLLAEVKRLCDELKKRESSLDLLYLSAGYVPFSGRVGMSYSVAMLDLFTSQPRVNRC